MQRADPSKLHRNIYLFLVEDFNDNTLLQAILPLLPHNYIIRHRCHDYDNVVFPACLFENDIKRCLAVSVGGVDSRAGSKQWLQKVVMLVAQSEGQSMVSTSIQRALST